MTLKAALDDLIVKLGTAGLDSPALEARMLVQDCLGLSFAQIISDPDRELPAAQTDKLQAWATDRASGMPLAYLSGHKGFYKHDFLTEPGVLVPRPETELIIETSLRRVGDSTRLERVADLGCGTGCIGLSLLVEFSSLRLWAVDASATAIALCERNAERLGVGERVTLTHTTVAAFSPARNFDLIVANPPYIAGDDPNLQPSVRQFEPALALFSGQNGLEAIYEWAAWAIRHLRPGGLFICEFGAGQSGLVEREFARLGFTNVQIERDLAGHDRVISAERMEVSKNG